MRTRYQTIRPAPLMAWAIALVALAQGAWAAVTPLAHVETKGSGPVQMLLIPGLGDDWSVWRGFMERNGDKYTMHAVTLPGFAGSAAPPTPAEGDETTAWLDNALEALAALVDEKKLEKPVIAGQASLGGFLAIELAVRLQERAGPVIIVDALAPALPLAGAASPTPVQRQQFVTQFAPLLMQMTNEDWARYQNPAETAIDQEYAARVGEMLAKTPREVGIRYLVELMRKDLTEAVRNVQAPILMIYPLVEEPQRGVPPSRGDMTKEASRATMADKFGVKTVRFYRSRRFIMHDHPAAFDSVVEDFLSGRDLYDFIPPNRIVPKRERPAPPAPEGEREGEGEAGGAKEPAAALKTPPRVELLPGEITRLAHVEQHGHGPQTLILIPGLPCDWTVWEAFMRRNSERYTMYAVTLPGLGGSAPAPLPVRQTQTPWIDNAIGALALFIEEKRLGKPVIVGHSMGAVLAMRFAMEKPGLVSRVIAIDGYPAVPLGQPMSPARRYEFVREAVEPQMRSNTDEQWAAGMRRAGMMSVTDPERGAELAEMFASTPPEISIQYYIEMLGQDLSARMGELQAPTLVMAAINDTPLPNQTPATMRQFWRDSIRLAPDGALVFFEDTRHFIMDDRPREFDQAVADYLAGKPVKGVEAPENSAE